ncbi:FAD-dependent oxidoreductase [Enterovirga rhinocerotis]|uniref:Rubredoxin-NAD+ reductase n=1 Tax=Enterovirga rhinocerotis TaxID=1339210 RepID=A0A4R7BTB9_9HYPH|nr:FAD-dependent oxidoreductase [Enterovirga rhinocerotis]TDR88988.1 rubredoxin-NAD+ reductase [Enterovirga rhinocerotis]
MSAEASGPEPTDGLGPWRQYLCRACGLIYDEGEGDPDGGLPPGTRFEDIPDDWECPVCGVTKADFEPYRRRERAAAPVAPMGARETGIVIVGAGLAGWTVAEALRSLDGAVPITMVTACPGDVYHKPELSVALSRGLGPERLRRETGAAAAARLGIRLLSETFAIGLCASSRRLRTTRGTLRYTSLVLAQGARSALPPGLPPELCWRVNDLGSWSGLHRALAGGPKRVAVIGAGMVGCELAEDLARAGHRVSLLSMTALPLAELLPEPAAKRLAAGLARSGVDVRGGAIVSGLARRPDDTIDVALRNMPGLVADLVVAATGLATQGRLARAAGLAFDRGIVVDPSTLATSAPDVYALGDCVSFGGMPCRFIEPIPHQADAIAHAVLGLPHAGYDHAETVIRLKTSSTPLVLHGLPRPGGDWRILEDSADRLVMEQWRGGKPAVRLAA